MTAFDNDPKHWMGWCGRLADEAEDACESPESTDGLTVFDEWLEECSQLSSVLILGTLVLAGIPSSQSL
jgi:hypothetical protein